MNIRTKKGNIEMIVNLKIKSVMWDSYNCLKKHVPKILYVACDMGHINLCSNPSFCFVFQCYDVLLPLFCNWLSFYMIRTRHFHWKLTLHGISLTYMIIFKGCFKNHVWKWLIIAILSFHFPLHIYDRAALNTIVLMNTNSFSYWILGQNIIGNINIIKFKG